MLRLCGLLGVDPTNIYPDGKLTFIGTRNDMVHAGKVPERKKLAEEIKKLTRLIELLLTAAFQRPPK